MIEVQYTQPTVNITIQDNVICVELPPLGTMTNYLEFVTLVNQNGDTLVNQNGDTLCAFLLRSSRPNVITVRR